MNSFRPGFLESHPISPSLLSAVRAIGEHRGREQLHETRAPEVLETLREAALIASTESSNRIEGVSAPHERIEDLVVRGDRPRNRSEQEIAGYRDVLATIHANWAHMEFTPGLVLQLHRDLYRFVPGRGGHWKTAPNQITETLPDGTVRVRFDPVPPHRTAAAMETLHERFHVEWESGAIEPLLLIGAYVLDFLSIHPFLDGNGRMARLLTLLLLYRAGYGVGRYISLERVVEDTRDGYYEALFASSQDWHEGKHSLLPWWEYFLGVAVLTAYRVLDERVGAITSRRGAKRQMVMAAIHRLPETFSYAEVARACPGVSRPTIQRALRSLRDDGEIQLLRRGRDATWAKRPSE
ncbi:MAG: Fic family protein [Gemmatimonadota bacterium]